MLVNGFESEYPFVEKFVTKLDQIYEIRVDTLNLFAGDRLERFIVSANNITRIMLTIDGNAVYSENFQSLEEVNIKPFFKGINIFSCKNSEVILYIKSSIRPVVKTMYSLLNPSQKAEHVESIGELSYRNGYAYLNKSPVGR
jgi:hypothetical protein